MNWQRLLKQLVLDGIREMTRQSRKTKRRQPAPQRPRQPAPAPQDLDEPRSSQPGGQRPVPSSQSSAYPGDYTGPVRAVYDPHPDGRPDPGEIVWTWVPYEEDHLQGKDRPVLLVGRDGDWLLGLQVTSQDHDRDAVQEARAGRYWVDIGEGDWDRKRRPSEVRVNRFIRIDPDSVRRIGAILDEDRFQRVVEGIRRYA